MPGGTKANKTLILSFAIAAVFSGSGIAYSQQATNNSAAGANLSLSTTAEYDTNPGLSAGGSDQFRLSEDIGLTLFTETRTSRLQLTGSAQLDATFSNGTKSFGFKRPTVGILYTKDLATTSFSASYDYSDQDVISSYDADPSILTNIIVDTGTVLRQSANATLQLDKGGTMDTTLSADWNEVDYSGITNPALFDERKFQVASKTLFRFSPSTTGQVDLKFEDYEAQNAFNTDTETTTVALSLKHELARALTIDANVGVQSQRSFAGGGSTVTDGFTSGLKLTQALPRGDIFAGIQFDGTGPTDKTSLSFGHSLTLPRGSLSASVTATDVQGTGVQWGGSAAYSQKLADGSLDLSLSRSLSTNNQRQDILFTQLSMGYLKQINQTSDLGLSLDLSRSEDGGAGAAPTVSRGTLQATLNRALTPDWDLALGYRHRLFDSSAGAPANSDSIFLTVTRNFQFGF